MGEERVVRCGDGTRRVAISPHLQAEDGEGGQRLVTKVGEAVARRRGWPGSGALGFRLAKTCMVISGEASSLFLFLVFFLKKVLHNMLRRESPGSCE